PAADAGESGGAVRLCPVGGHRAGIPPPWSGPGGDDGAARLVSPPPGGGGGAPCHRRRRAPVPHPRVLRGGEPGTSTDGVTAAAHPRRAPAAGRGRTGPAAWRAP